MDSRRNEMSARGLYDPDRRREEDFLYAIDGVMQPHFRLCTPRPLRMTNQLQHLRNVVMKSLWRHPLSQPFREPVDVVKLCIPDYRRIIRHPMDLGTIKKRLENCYYVSGEECIDDFYTMFNNCYTYHKPGEDIVLAARILEKVFRAKVREMPEEEMDLPLPPPRDRKDTSRRRRLHDHHGQAAAAAVATLPHGAGAGDLNGQQNGASSAGSSRFPGKSLPGARKLPSSAF